MVAVKQKLMRPMFGAHGKACSSQSIAFVSKVILFRQRLIAKILSCNDIVKLLLPC